MYESDRHTPHDSIGRACAVVFRWSRVPWSKLKVTGSRTVMYRWIRVPWSRVKVTGSWTVMFRWSRVPWSRVKVTGSWTVMYRWIRVPGCCLGSRWRLVCVWTKRTSQHDIVGRRSRSDPGGTALHDWTWRGCDWVARTERFTVRDIDDARTASAAASAAVTAGWHFSAGVGQRGTSAWQRGDRASTVDTTDRVRAPREARSTRHQQAHSGVHSEYS